MFVITMGGMARVGKTEAAEILSELAHENGFFPKHISFAQPLKEAVAEENGYGKDWKNFKVADPETYRLQCQSIGAARREEDPEYWVNLWKETLYKEMQTELNRDKGKDKWRETIVIVDDCRYENELDAADEFDGVSLFLSKGSRELSEESASWRTHESERLAMLSEAEQDKHEQLWDWWVVNDSDTADLEEKLEARAKYLLGNHPDRWLPSCVCADCQAFRADIGKEEIADGLSDVLDALLESNKWSEEDTMKLTRAFEDIKNRLRDGEATIDSFFAPGWWETLCEEYGIGDPDND